MCICGSVRVSRELQPQHRPCPCPPRDPPRPRSRAGRGRRSRSAGRAARPRRAPTGPLSVPQPLPSSKAPLSRESPPFEENVLISRGNAALSRGDRALISRWPARTCAWGGGRVPATGRHSRVRLRRRAAGTNGVRVCANADVNFAMVMHGAPGTCTASFVGVSLTNSSPSELQRQNAHGFF